MLIHTGPIGMYKKIEEKVKEIIPLSKLNYVAFLHFESDEWGGMAFLDSADARLVCSDLSSKLNLTGWYNIPVDHISFWDNEILKTGKRRFRFIMTPHVHHWESKTITEEDLSDSMLALYRGAGIFASEGPVRQTTKRLERLNPKMVFPMHGSCIDGSVFPKYVDAIMDNEFAYSGMLLGQEL